MKMSAVLRSVRLISRSRLLDWLGLFLLPGVCPAAFMAHALEPQMFAISQGPTLEDALDAPAVQWTTGSHPWRPQTEITHDGVDAAVSGAVHNSDDHSWLKATNRIGPGTVSFRWKAQVSGGAFASFRVSGGTGVWPEAIELTSSTDWRWETAFFPQVRRQQLGDAPHQIPYINRGLTGAGVGADCVQRRLIPAG